MDDKDTQNDWFKRYIDKVMLEIERLDKCCHDVNDCVKGKMSKMKPAAIIGAIIVCLTIYGLTIAAYNRNITERQTNIKYMIMAEAKKVDQKLDNYCTKDKFHGVDKKLDSVEKDVGYIKNEVKQLKLNSEEVLKAIRRMERVNKSKRSNNEN